jgi:hypothetical protein
LPSIQVYAARLLASRRRILQEYCAWGVTVRRQRDHHAKEFTSINVRFRRNCVAKVAKR